jgi:hypothetical protein
VIVADPPPRAVPPRRNPRSNFFECIIPIPPFPSVTADTAPLALCSRFRVSAPTSVGRIAKRRSESIHSIHLCVWPESFSGVIGPLGLGTGSLSPVIWATLSGRPRAGRTHTGSSLPYAGRLILPSSILRFLRGSSCVSASLRGGSEEAWKGDLPELDGRSHGASSWQRHAPAAGARDFGDEA